MPALQQCPHVCPCCGCDHSHWVVHNAHIDEWKRICSRCAATGKFDVVGYEIRRDQMSEREELIAGLMNPGTSPVIDFEASYKDLYVYGCDRAHASRLADRIIAEG